MNLQKALEIVFDLAEQNVVDENEMPGENKRQNRALNAVHSALIARPIAFNIWEAKNSQMEGFRAPTDEEYLCTVMFRRNLADDEEFTKGKTGKEKLDALAKQLAIELQAGFDEAAIAGHFQIARVETLK